MSLLCLIVEEDVVRGHHARSAIVLIVSDEARGQAGQVLCKYLGLSRLGPIYDGLVVSAKAK